MLTTEMIYIHDIYYQNRTRSAYKIYEAIHVEKI